MNVLPTVWAIGALLIVLLCGVVARLTGLIPVSAIGPYNKLIFTFGIPCLAFNAMATHSVQTLDWTFVLIFLAVRAVAACIAGIYTFFTHGNFGDFAVHYLAPTWIDVITFGVPIISVMFTPAIGTHYPVLAAFSSFIFELPLVLICLEISRLRDARRRLRRQKLSLEEGGKVGELKDVVDDDSDSNDNKKSKNEHVNDSKEPLLKGSDDDAKVVDSSSSSSNDSNEGGSDTAIRNRKGHSGDAGSENFKENNENEGDKKEKELNGNDSDDQQTEKIIASVSQSSTTEYTEESFGQQARRIPIFVGKRLLQTPPIIAIVLGLIYGSIQIPVPDILAKVISYLGGLVTPIASFSVGMFVCDGAPFKRAWRKTIVYMLLKMFAMPLLALLVVYVSGIKNPAAEVAVIIASLPLAFPAFTITKQYGLGEDVMSTCITTGTILMLPTVLFWWWVVEAIDIFPDAPSPPAFNASSSSSYSSLSFESSSLSSNYTIF